MPQEEWGGAPKMGQQGGRDSEVTEKCEGFFGFPDDPVMTSFPYIAVFRQKLVQAFCYIVIDG